MKKLLLFSVSLLFAGIAFGQMPNPVKWSYEAKKVADGEYDLVFTANAQDGWYVYSQFLDENGPIPTSFAFDENANVAIVGKAAEAGHKYEGYDALFDMDIVKFSGSPTFTQRVKVKAATKFTGTVTFMTCDNERCLPPVDVPFQFTL